MKWDVRSSVCRVCLTQLGHKLSPIACETESKGKELGFIIHYQCLSGKILFLLVPKLPVWNVDFS